MGEASITPGVVVYVRPEGDEVVVKTSGALDVVSAPGLRQTLAQLIEGGAARVVVDLRDTPYLDSIALGVLVGALKRARNAGSDLTLEAPQRRVYELMDLTGLTEVFPITSA